MTAVKEFQQDESEQTAQGQQVPKVGNYLCAGSCRVNIMINLEEFGSPISHSLLCADITHDAEEKQKDVAVGQEFFKSLACIDFFFLFEFYLRKFHQINDQCHHQRNGRKYPIERHPAKTLRHQTVEKINQRGGMVAVDIQHQVTVQ